MLPKTLLHSKAIILDFDGVVIDSEAYKIEIFKSLFADFPKHVSAIDTYNRSKRGVNRRIKFEHIYKNILRLPYTDATIEQLASRYSHKLKQNFGEVGLINGIEEFLVHFAQPKFIASSSDQKELEQILELHDLRRYFDEVYGHPFTKSEAINHVLQRLELQPHQLTFIGDALADHHAAQSPGVHFIARSDNPTLFPASIRRISSFRALIT